MRNKVKYSIFQFHKKAKHWFHSRMEKVIQKKRFQINCLGSGNSTEITEIQNIWQHMEVRVSGACSKQGETRAFRAFLTQVLKSFRTAQTFWATYSNTSISLQWEKVSYLQFELQISMLALYADLNLLFSLHYHHTVCLSLPGAFTVVLQHCLPFYTAEEQKSSAISELRGTSQSLLISQIPKKWGFWRYCRTKHALFSFCSSNGNFHFAVLWLLGWSSFVYLSESPVFSPLATAM